MSDDSINQWITVNEYMTAEFRDTVAEVALTYYPRASKELRDSTRKLFSGIKISGYRSFERAPVALVRPHVVEGMQRVPVVADTVICLWAEAAQPIISELRDAAIEAGLALEPSWEWHDGIKGYLDLEDVSPLADVVESLVVGRPEVEGNHLRLAALWLSRAVLPEAGNDEEIADWDEVVESEEPEADGSKSVSAELLDSVSSNQDDAESPVREKESIMNNDLRLGEQEIAPDNAQDGTRPPNETDIAPLDDALPEHETGLALYETMSLEQLKPLLMKENGMCGVTKGAFIDKLRVLLLWTEDGFAGKVANDLPSFLDLFWEWNTAIIRLMELVTISVQRLTSEYATRPDLDWHDPLPPYLTDLPESSDRDQGMPDVHAVIDLIEQITLYDQQRMEIWEAIDALHARAAETLERVQYWSPDDRVDLTEYSGDQADHTLSELVVLLEQMRDDQARLDSQLSQIRNLSANRVGNLISALQEFGVSSDTEVVPGMVLEQITPDTLTPLSDSGLRTLEQALSDRVSEETTKASRSEFVELATELQTHWDDRTLQNVLAGLANHGRDAECFLLLVASNAAYPRSGVLNLEAPVIESVLRGISQFSDKSRPFELLNVLAPEFMNGWGTQDPVAQTRLCLVFLAAQYASECPLPDGFLWQLPNEWPVASMPTWNKLWQAALLDEAMTSIVASETNDTEVRLSEARRKLEQVFEHDGRMFVILKSHRSRRHMALMNSRFLPDLQSSLRELDQSEAQIKGSIEQHPDQLAVLLPRLRRAVDVFQRSSTEDALLDKYEEIVVEEGVDDTHPFHRRIALRTLQEASEATTEYCAALLNYWESRAVATSVLSRQALEAELRQLPNPTPLEKPVLDELALRGQTDRAVRDIAKARSLGYRLIAQQLLGTSDYGLRLPRLICFLTEKPFAWSELVDPILQDLSTPLEVAEVATLLLEHEAVSQVLLLTKHGIPVEQQKQAQQMLDRMQREVNDLQRELLKTGGAADDLDHDRQLGRWRLVRQQLSKRLDREREQQRTAKTQVESAARNLRGRIHELEETVFAMRDTMPSKAYELVAQGMQLARKATLREEMFPIIEEYLNETAYRVDHLSWPLPDLERSLGQFRNSVEGGTPASEAQLSTSEILKLLENDELRQLGLTPTLVSPSEVGTRIDLLRNWNAVRSMQAFFGEDMTMAERSEIQAMYRSFSQMIAMRYGRTPDNKPLVFDYPVIYSIYELQFPKTPVLEKPFVLLTLPGQPISPSRLKDIGNLIDERKWLDDAFVVMFAPGCTSKIRDRLLMDHHNRGLVVIDETTMRELVLANADSRTPLGRFRSMMLNALGAADIDIFKVNQLVNARNAIFVGRDRLVDRIASSGDNYALYGGRRIGKSSVLAAVETRLLKRGATTVSYSFEGYADCSDDATAVRLARELRLNDTDNGQSIEVVDVDTFKMAVQNHLDNNPDVRIALLLDEIDRYIDQNKERHVFIEALRSLSDRFTSRFRVVIAGFMSLYDCMKGRSPYSPTSDPWRRMLNDIDAIPNLRPNQAEDIVREGIKEILDWQFENRAIPQLVVERTGGHPAFVQYFCLKLQHRVAQRGDRLVRIADVEEVFSDRDPSQSFVAYVEKTLEMNLNPISRYLILILALESSEARGFTLDQIRELARYSPTPIPEIDLNHSLERLAVTSVVKEKSSGVYEFTVPDYPLILKQLGITGHMRESELERQIKQEIEQIHELT